MSDLAHSDCYASPELARLFDQRCDQFEAQCKAGRSPRLEDFLADVTGTDRSVLLDELLAVELAYRTSPPPALVDYERRFPDNREQIRSAFSRAMAGSSDSQVPTRLLSHGRRPPQTSAALPEMIGKYRIVERLGRAESCEIFRAVHPNLPGRDVVVQWDRTSVPAEQRARFLEEGQVLARLDDPGLVRVYDIGVHEDRPFVVREYVIGSSLEERLREGLPPFRESARLVAQMAATLERIHAHGISHRNLTPANILFDASGRLRLVNFALTQDAASGPRRDVSALGTIFYHLLTGRPPDRETAVLPPRRINAEVPPLLEFICLKALAADEPYASAGALEHALAGYLARPGRLRMAALGAVIAAAVAVLLAAALTYRP